MRISSSGVTLAAILTSFRAWEWSWCSSLCRTRGSLQLGIRMLHCITPALVDVTTEGLDLCIRAAEFLDHTVDSIELISIVVRYGDGLLVGIKDDFHGISPLFHKLLYFAQRESIIQTDTPLFDASFYGWRFGPILKEIREA